VLHSRTSFLEKQWQDSLAANHLLRRQFMEDVDRPLDPIPVTPTIEPPNEEEMHRLIKDFVETNPAHPLTMVLDKAGLNMQVRQSKENHKLQLVKAV
jgi:transposase